MSSVTQSTPAPQAHNEGRLPPELIILAGCLIGVLTFGPRSALGVFQIPVLTEYNWGSDIFSFAMAMQYLFWGIGQPFAGAMADRYGSYRVLTFGTLLYASGLIIMSYATTPLSFNLTSGLLMGFGLSGCSFNLVIGALGKLVPPHMRSMAFGLGTAAGSFGQFLFTPLAGFFVATYTWHTTAFIFGALMLLVLPLAFFVKSPPLNDAKSEQGVRQQNMSEALREAFGYRSYVLLVIGFFTCGFQLAFVTIHFQKYVVESGLAPQIGYWAFAFVGIFNIFGSLAAGWLGTRMPRRWILSFIYLARALVTVLFIALPATAMSTYVFGALTGLLWLSTVPPTSSLIGMMFGTRYFSMLYGFAFFSHQLGGFVGLILSGTIRESMGSYIPMWWLSIALGIASALINLPIVEKPIAREGAAAAA
jgi:MFS family permease